VKFTINEQTFEVKALPQGKSWPQLPNACSNGQHYQVPGLILAEYHPSEGELVLLHPDTCPSSGHQDVRYYHQRRDGKYGVSILTYHCLPVELSNDQEVKRCWPSGGEHLLKTIDAAEKHLEMAIGYNPKLMSYIVQTFRQTPRPSPIPSGMV
jgi:hypothetical protein